MLAACGAFGAANAQTGADDAAITERVTGAIDHHPVLRKMDISVETRDGVVYLKGFVRSKAQIDMAGELARSVKGVTAVRNAVRVANRPSQAERPEAPARG